MLDSGNSYDGRRNVQGLLSMLNAAVKLKVSRAFEYGNISLFLALLLASLRAAETTWVFLYREFSQNLKNCKQCSKIIYCIMKKKRTRENISPEKLFLADRWLREIDVGPLPNLRWSFLWQ